MALTNKHNSFLQEQSIDQNESNIMIESKGYITKSGSSNLHRIRGLHFSEIIGGSGMLIPNPPRISPHSILFFLDLQAAGAVNMEF